MDEAFFEKQHDFLFLTPNPVTRDFVIPVVG
jgi:hypothetical protein